MSFSFIYTGYFICNFSQISEIQFVAMTTRDILSIEQLPVKGKSPYLMLSNDVSGLFNSLKVGTGEG